MEAFLLAAALWSSGAMVIPFEEEHKMVGKVVDVENVGYYIWAIIQSVEGHVRFESECTNSWLTTKKVIKSESLGKVIHYHTPCLGS